MTTAPAPLTTVDHGELANFDVNLDCTCGRVWRPFPRAMPTPYAVIVEPLPAGKYRPIWPSVPLEVATDDGKALFTGTTRVCLCGVLQTFRTPTYDRIECSSCTTAAWKRTPPADYYINPRYGMACACCGHSGHHQVRRDQLADWQCRSSW